MLRYLAVLTAMLACFTGHVSAVTDQEFQDLSDKVNAQALLIDQLTLKLMDQSSVISEQAAIIQQLQETDQTITGRVDKFECVTERQRDLVQNTTIEERVTTLEVQMIDVQEDITEINDDVTDLDNDVNFLFEEQVIQDERLLNLEESSVAVTVELVQINEDIQDLQDTTLALDFRVTVLEENGGGDGNSSVSELEVRVEALEGTAADHEARITSSEAELEDLEGTVIEQETRLTAAEENIQGLQATDISLDARITDLEENGGGSFNNETIAFSATLTEYGTISGGTTVEFNEILLNEGNGYDNTTGVFTVPSGGGGTYYFSTYVLASTGEWARVDIELNNDVICSAFADMNSGGAGDQVTSSCSAVVSVVEGDDVYVLLAGATDDTPLQENTLVFFNGFNGFRI